jgi:L-amino acid N-acyltransferase YncA
MIRPATIKDFKAIEKIYQSHLLDQQKVAQPNYAAKMQKSGFLLDLSDATERQKRVETSQLFKVYEENGQVFGFIDINKEIYFPEEADNIVWFDQQRKQEYFHGKNSTVLHLIAVDQKATSKGIASQLLQGCLEDLKKQGMGYLFSLIVFGPVTNCPSLVFHHKHGFERVSVAQPIDLFGFKNYQSLLFVKKL